jgi:hypothetical protein
VTFPYIHVLKPILFLRPSITLPHPFPPFCIIQQFSVCFLVPYSYTGVMYFNIIQYYSFSVILFSSFYTQPPLTAPLLEKCCIYIHIHIYVHMYNRACICVWICLPYIRETTPHFLNLAYFT